MNNEKSDHRRFKLKALKGLKANLNKKIQLELSSLDLSTDEADDTLVQLLAQLKAVESQLEVAKRNKLNSNAYKWIPATNTN